jgi:hypothetical protein
MPTATTAKRTSTQPQKYRLKATIVARHTKWYGRSSQLTVKAAMKKTA